VLRQEQTNQRRRQRRRPKQAKLPPQGRRVPTDLQAEVFRLLPFVQQFLDRKKPSCSVLDGKMTSRAEGATPDPPRSVMTRKDHRVARFLDIPDPGLRFGVHSSIEQHRREFEMVLSGRNYARRSLRASSIVSKPLPLRANRARISGASTIFWHLASRVYGGAGV